MSRTHTQKIIPADSRAGLPGDFLLSLAMTNSTDIYWITELCGMASRQRRRADVEDDLDGFFPKVQDILGNFGFRKPSPTPLDRINDGYLVDPTVVEVRTEITSELLSEEGVVVSCTDDTDENQQETYMQPTTDADRAAA